MYTKDIDQSLATELFHRTSISAAVGILGVGIMVYPHIGAIPWQHFLAWATAMVLIFVVRIAFANRALAAIGSGQPARRFVDFETFLCILLGFGWGRSVYVFDSTTMDAAFFLRLMILSSAIAFVLSSTAVFLRVFLAYVLPIYATVAAFVLTHDYVEPRTILLVSIALYMLMILGLAVVTNSRIRKATDALLSVLRLTDDLNGMLVREQAHRDELDRFARTDPLTGILNRRGILASMETDMAKCRRFGWPLAVLMIDIDYFKRINDTYGHAAGDAAIQAVVRTLQEGLRETDVLGRLGGEEFLIVLPVLEPDGAVAVAERLRAAVASVCLPLAGQLVGMTISTGVAFHDERDGTDELLARADTALYAAKRNGRNRVEGGFPAVALDNRT